MAKRGPKPKSKGTGTKARAGRGKRGPAKTATAKLKLHNSRLAKSRTQADQGANVEHIEGNTVAFPTTLPQRPVWCTKRRHEIWDSLIDLYCKDYKDLLGEIDCYVLARYCDLLAWYLDLRKAVEQEGEIKTLYNKQGSEYLSTNPKAALALRVAMQLTKLENELYLTPAARQGLVLKKSDEKPNSLAAFLNRNKNAG